MNRPRDETSFPVIISNINLSAHKYDNVCLSSAHQINKETQMVLYHSTSAESKAWY